MVDLLEDPVHEGKLREGVFRIQVKMRAEPCRIRMGEFVSPLVEVSLHVAGGKLSPPFVKCKDQLHQNS